MRNALSILGYGAIASIAPLAGCTATHSSGFADEGLSSNQTISHAHVMPMQTGAAAKPMNATVAQAESVKTASAAHLTYQGGPLIQNAKVYAVFWGSGVNSSVTSGIGAYYSAVTNSSYFDWLNEYNAGGSSIGRGSYGGDFTIAPSASGTKLDDSQIGAEIDAQISAGKLPKNDGNSLYMVYFPPGVNITLSGQKSCVQFCAYHSTVSRSDGSLLYYGVMPDLGGACAGGCGAGSQFQSTTEVSSHEMIEAVTDPAIGINKISWYDNSQGEIGDICNGQAGTVAGYQVQLEWSNKYNQCIAAAPGGGSSSGGSGGGSGSGSGSGSSSGSSSGGGSGSGSSSGSSGSGSGSSSGGSSSSGSGSSSGGVGSSSGSSSGGVGSSSGGGTCSATEQEPNDRPAMADDLSGGCLSGAISPGADLDLAAFALNAGTAYDVSVAGGGDANVILYKWYQGSWTQVTSTSPTEVKAVSSGGYYLTQVFSPGQSTQSYTVTLLTQ